MVIGGDFNAEIGLRQPGEDDAVIGPHGAGSRNKRGDAMAKWALRAEVSVANTFFEKPWGRTWTHKYKGRERTIDYFCVTKGRRKLIQDVQIWRRLNLGSDHRAVRLDIRLPGRARARQAKGPRTKRGGKGWKPESSKDYKDKLADA